MRLVSYNILDGGLGRADPLAEVIEAQRPDIIVLVEADDPTVIDRIAGRLRMDAIAVQGKRHGAAILSRYQIVESVNHSLLSDAFTDCVLEATLRQPDGRQWPIIAVHLHPRAADSDESIRQREIESLLQITADLRSQNQPHLLAGDFNANSPIQQIDIEKCKPKTRKEFAANGGSIPRRAISQLLQAGYVDSLHAVQGDAAKSIASFTTQYPGQRVDYIFTHGIDPSRLNDARVEHDRLARYASDHFPVVLQVD